MSRWSGRCRVFTWKEGLLSAIAHDLEIDVPRFTVDVDETDGVVARFDASSLVVLHALSDGRPTSALSARDRSKIEATMRDEVLHSARHPEIVFRSTSVTRATTGLVTIAGELALHGRTRPISLTATPTGDGYAARVELQQPDFGITPYSAMMGTLKIRPAIAVAVELHPPSA